MHSSPTFNTQKNCTFPTQYLLYIFRTILIVNSILFFFSRETERNHCEAGI